MTYRLHFERTAGKQLRTLPPEVLKRVDEKLRLLVDDPRPPGAKKLRGRENDWRLRVGDYRILYDIDDRVGIVRIYKIAPRGEAYR